MGVQAGREPREPKGGLRSWSCDPPEEGLVWDSGADSADPEASQTK